MQTVDIRRKVVDTIHSGIENLRSYSTAPRFRAFEVVPLRRLSISILSPFPDSRPKLPLSRPAQVQTRTPRDALSFRPSTEHRGLRAFRRSLPFDRLELDVPLARHLRGWLPIGSVLKGRETPPFVTLLLPLQRLEIKVQGWW